jgi:hypothetical protein
MNSQGGVGHPGPGQSSCREQLISAQGRLERVRDRGAWPLLASKMTRSGTSRLRILIA